MRSVVCFFLTLMAGVPIIMDAQSIQNQNIRFCSAGIQPDGYIDWRGLPSSSSAALNATVPVTGISAVAVNVTLSAGMNSGVTYQVVSPTELMFTATSPLTLVFSQPVKGVSTSIDISGRFERTLTMSAYSDVSQIGAALPPIAQVSNSAFDHPSSGDVATAPLQIRSEAANIKAVVIQGTAGPEYSFYGVKSLRIESGGAPDAATQITKSGLKQWLRADTVYDPFEFSATRWPDQSGNGNDALSQAGTSFLTQPDGPTCSPVVIFNGSESLTANLPISGWTGMTIFLVASASQDASGWWEGQPVYWKESANWGTTFLTPSQSHVFFRFGTTQVNNEPIYTRPVNVAGDYSVTTAMHDNQTDSLFVNGVLAVSQSGRKNTISGLTGTEIIGSSLLGASFHGAIGELLVYDRALTDTERETVEHYLRQKFGIN